MTKKNIGKKILAILAGIVILILIFGVLGYFLFIKAPSAEAYCDKFVSLLKEDIEASGLEAGSDEDYQNLRDECLKEEEKKEEGTEETFFETKRRRDCVLNQAETFDQAIEFDQNKEC